MRRAIDLFEGDKINDRALKALIRAAIELNQAKSSKTAKKPAKKAAAGARATAKKKA